MVENIKGTKWRSRESRYRVASQVPDWDPLGEVWRSHMETLAGMRADVQVDQEGPDAADGERAENNKTRIAELPVVVLDASTNAVLTNLNMRNGELS